ncbi:DNA (cytosine-5-)-methyltransferase [Alkalihalobacterium elongatum]|uniref:DNA (cytosine-5-)-methyltransferase n=1 Tax=Alkalihalobacterium elongatum TaxID=2675466 RepID=UPI001C1F3285|nr:DNA (cytosine-5-)-methyltransferase [Alkalihalobacterium elongatum]
MPFSYDRLWKLTADIGMNKTTLRDECGITSASLARLSKNENVRMEVLERICSYLESDIEDIMEYVPERKKMKKNSDFKFIDLFAGIGGFRLAGEKNGMECVFSSEIDKFACDVYKNNFGEMPEGDITKIQTTDIPDFDVLFAGFPCQPFSYAGQLQGFEDEIRGTLFFDIVRILKEKKPKMFLLENVKGLKSHEKGKTLETILEHLEQLGYHVHWTILNSLHFGVPQSRERWYCVGFDKDVSFDFPKPTNKKVTLRDIIEWNENNSSLSLSEFEMGRIKYHFNCCPLESSEQIRVEHDNSNYAPNTKKGKYGVFSYLKPDKSLRFHVGDFAKTQIQEAYYCNLDSFAPSIIAARAPKLWDLGRHLSDRECARLQGFPEDFKLANSSAQAKKQLGNSVTVTVISEIIKNMRQAYEADIPAEKQLKLMEV